MRSFEELSADRLAAKRVLLRVDLNVPLERGVVRDDFRLQRIVPTVKKLLAGRAQVIMLAHLGKMGESLEPVARYLEKFFPVRFLANTGVPESVAWAEGPVVLLENLRRDPGEENNSPVLARQLALLGDLYINEAFSVSHRAHASIVGLPALLPSYAGLALAEEIKQLAQLFKPVKPLVVIIGGAKFGTKLPLVRRFLDVADKIFIGGALAHSFFKFLGYEIGQSLWDDISGLDDLARDPRIVLPVEVLVKQGNQVGVIAPDRVPKDGVIVDASPAALGQLAELISGAKTILWNGPLGNYEQGFVGPTHDLATLIAYRHGELHAVVGGGDTVAAIEKLNIFNKFDFVSTGGGAMLDFLAEGTLPGLQALEDSAKKFGIAS